MMGAGDAHQSAVFTRDDVWTRRRRVYCRISSHFKDKDSGPCTNDTPKQWGGDASPSAGVLLLHELLRFSDTPGCSLWLQHLTQFSLGIVTWNCQPSPPHCAAGCKLQSLGFSPHVMVTKNELEAGFPASLKTPSWVGRLGQNKHQCNSPT